jgi:hypothetical protein
MIEFPEYDEKAALERIVREIHQDWKGLKDQSSTGQKSWLTQMKNHYLKIIEADAEAAAEMLASHEFYSHLVRKRGKTSTSMD